jgi:hypothetical protein
MNFEVSLLNFVVPYVKKELAIGVNKFVLRIESDAAATAAGGLI